MTGRLFTVLFLVVVVAAAACAAGCGGGQGSSGQPTLSATPEQRPELTLEAVREAINGEWVRAPAADGRGEPQGWEFGRNEPKEIEIVEQKVEGDRATFLVNIRTRSHPRARRQLSLEGQLRLHLELQTEFIFRRWEVTDIDNISFKYTNLTPSPSPEGSPQGSPQASPSGSPQGSPLAPPRSPPPQASPPSTPVPTRRPPS